ncbi:glutathione S-transferase C-terminal domain-containing protein [Streptomyces sp. NPDC057638]|uniref:glutathione S-transferase C-terminal domain-containing protein n=1 Tax=Streptomyces sp. NPDC057638 TaxID=3346190 RepID=UPI0036C7B672
MSTAPPATAPFPSAAPLPPAPPAFRGRIGRDARSGYHAAARRYRLYLSLSCPSCLRIALTHSLLGLRETLPVMLLPAVPDGPDGEYSVLRPLYESSSHRHPGPASAPVLSDDWSGRIVSTHSPDILRDLARHFDRPGPDRPALYPPGAEEEIETVARLSEYGIGEAARRAGRPGADAMARRAALGALFRALGSLERRLATRRFILGEAITIADVWLWVALVRFDTVHRPHLDAAAVHRAARHPWLWSYARRLAAHPAFGPLLDLDGIARRHRAPGKAPRAGGTPPRILDWSRHSAGGAAAPPSPVGADGFMEPQHVRHLRRSGSA